MKIDSKVVPLNKHSFASYWGDWSQTGEMPEFFRVIDVVEDTGAKSIKVHDPRFAKDNFMAVQWFPASLFKERG